MNEVITYTDYQSYKRELDAAINKTIEDEKKVIEDWVLSGYLLKVARDTNILKESGYKNITELAQNEYNLDKSRVSRYMKINDRFSEGGYSNRLKTEYQGYGYAKLSIMLQLPDEINEELTPDFSKAEIQAIKDEVDEEKKISDIEVMLEKKDEVQQSLDSLLEQVLFQMGKDDPKVFDTLWTAREEEVSYTETVNRLAPAGQAVYSVRIPGKGRMMLSINEASDSVNITNVRTNEKETHTKQEVVEAFEEMIIGTEKKEAYQNMYGISFPEEKKPEVAPVQQKTKSEPRKESKVKKAKVEKEPVTDCHELKEPEVQQEEQLPGQTSIETDFPEYMPDDVPAAVETAMEELEEAEKEPENVDSTKCESNSVRGYKAGITNALKRLEDAAAVEDWKEVAKLASDISWRAERIMEDGAWVEKMKEEVE